MERRLCPGGLQVNIVELKFLQALIDGFGNVFDPIRDFGCDEELNLQQHMSKTSHALRPFVVKC